MEKFNVIIEDPNKNEFISYDIMPYLVKCYKTRKKDKPKTFEEFKKFVDNESRYQFWSRCEYEIMLKSLFENSSKDRKIDVYQQIKMNLDIITKILMDILSIKNKKI